MIDPMETLRQRFTSGNDVPVSQARITREEYEALCREVEEQRSLISELRREILDTTWQDHADYWAQRSEKAERERDELRRELHRIADFVEPHWKGAGETLTSGWLYEEIVHNLKKYSFEVDYAEDRVEYLRRENKILKEDCERLRQKLQQGPKCANCCGHGTVEKPWGTHAPCEACNGKGF